MNHPSLRTAVLATAILAAAAIPSPAGPLDPPAGPITSTYKTLSDVEPRTAINSTNTPGAAGSFYRIAQPGSYYLTEEFAAPANVNGIEIAASDVTIDLMGFTVRGSNTSGLGIFTSGVRNNITVRNGTVTAWGDTGVHLISGGTGAVSLIESVLATGNGDYGFIGNTQSTLRSCVARSNGFSNILTGTGSVVESCTAQGALSGDGINAGLGSTIRGCAAFSNAGHGIAVGSGSTVAECSASVNTLHGISAGIGCTIVASAALDNVGNGISAGTNCSISGCAATSNSLDGILVSDGSLVTACIARLNEDDGIQVSSDCHVLANQCDNNGSVAPEAGIHAAGADNRIEANNCTDNLRGFKVDSAGNILIRNTASGNTNNYDIAASNVGQYISAATSGAVLGSTGGVSIGTTDPWANLSY